MMWPKYYLNPLQVIDDHPEYYKRYLNSVGFRWCTIAQEKEMEFWESIND